MCSNRRIAPDGILIDFYGTISAGDRQAVLNTCRTVVETLELAITPEDFAVKWGDRFFAAIDSSNHDDFRTLYECEIASLRRTLAEFGEHGDPTRFLTELEDYWRNPPLHPDAVEFLARVDRPICCVSNADTEPLHTAIRKHNLRFGAVVSSEAVRCYKPEPLIFQQALERLGIAAERAVHIGDSLHSDMAGAAKLGITTIWLCRESRLHDIGNHNPDFTIATLTELSELIGA